MKWKLIELPIKDLKEHARNPRKIEKQAMERLTRLIDKFGLIDKPIANADYSLIGGHQRIKILKKKKEKMVECWVAETQLTDEEIDELCIGLNLHQGQWDWSIMDEHWNADELLIYGFSEEDIMSHMADAKSAFDESQEKIKNKMKTKTCPQCGHEF